MDVKVGRPSTSLSQHAWASWRSGCSEEAGHVVGSEGDTLISTLKCARDRCAGAAVQQTSLPPPIYPPTHTHAHTSTGTRPHATHHGGDRGEGQAAAVHHNTVHDLALGQTRVRPRACHHLPHCARVGQVAQFTLVDWTGRCRSMGCNTMLLLTMPVVCRAVKSIRRTSVSSTDPVVLCLAQYYPCTPRSPA